MSPPRSGWRLPAAGENEQEARWALCGHSAAHQNEDALIPLLWRAIA